MSNKGQMLQDPFLNIAAQGTRSGLDLPRQRHQAAGTDRVVRPVRRPAQEHRHADGVQARDLDRRSGARGGDAAPRAERRAERLISTRSRTWSRRSALDARGRPHDAGAACRARGATAACLSARAAAIARCSSRSISATAIRRSAWPRSTRSPRRPARGRRRRSPAAGSAPTPRSSPARARSRRSPRGAPKPAPTSSSSTTRSPARSSAISSASSSAASSTG